MKSLRLCASHKSPHATKPKKKRSVRRPAPIKEASCGLASIGKVIEKSTSIAIGEVAVALLHAGARRYGALLVQCSAAYATCGLCICDEPRHNDNGHEPC